MLTRKQWQDGTTTLLSTDQIMTKLGIFMKIRLIVVAFNKPWKISPAHSYMLKSVHICACEICHMQRIYYACEIWRSHAWQNCDTCVTRNKMYGQVHTYDENVWHVLQNFTCMSKSSHVSEMLMWWSCIFANINSTWFLIFTPFSHKFHPHSPSNVAVLAAFKMAACLPHRIDMAICKPWL